MLRLTAVVAALALVLRVDEALGAKPLFDDLHSEVVTLSKLNFNNNIKKNRDDHVSVVLFYAPHDGNSIKLAPEYIDLAKDLKGIVRCGVVDCDKEKDVCKEYSIETYPTLKLFPPGAYKFVQDYKGELKKDAIKKWVTKPLKSFVHKVDSATIDEWLATNKSKPHAILFTDKPKTASLTKALSVDFNGRISFGEAQLSDANLAKRFKVKKAPHLVIQLGDKESVAHKGKFDHYEIWKFMNSYAETNAMEKMHAPTDEGADEPKRPWLNQPIPQVTSESVNDVCLEQKGVCVIAFLKPQTPGGTPSSADMGVLLGLKNKFEANIDRGTKFAFMWVDALGESAFSAGFEISAQPSVIAFKPGKRKRWSLHEGAFTESAISGFCDKVMGGDVRFKAMDNLPKLTPTPPQEKKEKK